MSSKIDMESYAKSGDATSLQRIDGKEFTVTHIDQHDYEDNGERTLGVMFTTQESFEIDGVQIRKFYTTRGVITKKFISQDGLTQLAKDVNQEGAELKVKTVSRKSAKGREYFDLEQC